MKTQFPQCPDTDIKGMIEFFHNEFFPNVTQEEAYIIADSMKWSREKQMAYLMALSFFEDPEL